MNKGNGHAGVLPLVCAVCEQPVGVINQPALAAMLDNDKLYICHNCEEFGGPYIEQQLEKQEPDHYAYIIGRELLAVILATTETAAAEAGRTWTVSGVAG